MKNVCEECNGTGECMRAECLAGIHVELSEYCDACEGDGYIIFDLYEQVKKNLEIKRNEKRSRC